MSVKHSFRENFPPFSRKSESRLVDQKNAAKFSGTRLSSSCTESIPCEHFLGQSVFGGIYYQAVLKTKTLSPLKSLPNGSSLASFSLVLKVHYFQYRGSSAALASAKKRKTEASFSYSNGQVTITEQSY